MIGHYGSSQRTATATMVMDITQKGHHNMDHLEAVLEKTGRILTERYGIRIICEGNRCCTDNRAIYLPALPDDVPEDLWKTIRGYVDHEGAHHIFRSSFSVAKEFRNKHGDEAFGLLNLLEDLRVERAMMERIPGSRANLHHAYAAAEKSATETAAAGRSIPFMRQLAFAATVRVNGRPTPSFVDASVTALAKEIEHEITSSATSPNTKAVARLAESAWEKIMAHRPASAKSGSTAGDTSGNPASPKSDPTAGTVGGGSGDEDTTGPSGSSGGDQSGTPRRRKKNNSTSTTAQTNPASSPCSGSGTVGGHNSAAGDASASNAGVIGGLGAEIAGAVQQHATATNAYRIWSTASDVVKVADDSATGSHTDRMARLVPHVAGVRQKLLQTLMAESRARWMPDQEDGGHLNPRALYRLAADRRIRQTGSGVIGSDGDTQVRCLLPDATSPPRRTRGENTSLFDISAAGLPSARRIFRRRVVAERMKTAVTLLVDLSHSMQGRKLDLARDTAMVLCEALARLNIPVSVWGFSTQHTGRRIQDVAKEAGLPAETLERQYRFAPLVHEKFKDFHETFRNVSGRFAGMRTYMMTPLGESMLFAARTLARRPEPRRVLLTLTDGRPTVGMGDDVGTYNHAHEAIRRIERAGVDVLLVGIVERCVLDLHHRAVVVEEIGNLPRTVMSKMRALLSGRRQTTWHQVVGAA